MRILVSPFLRWGALASIAALVVWGLVTPWGRGLDFANFYDVGHKALLGEYATLYDHKALIGGMEPLGNMKYVSPPITSWFFMPLALMTPLVATFVFKLAGVLSVIAGLILLYRHIRPIAGTRAEYFALFALAAAAWQPLWTFMRVGGQTTPIVFLLLVIGHASYLRRQMAVTALIFSLIVLVKPVFAPIAILLFFVSGNRFRLTALSAALASIVASLMIFGWGPHSDFFRALGAQGDRLLEPWMNSSPVSWLVPLLVDISAFGNGNVLPVPVAILLTGLRVALAVALVAVMIGHLRAPLADKARQHVIYVTGLLLVIVLSPVIWAHYLMILFPLIAVLLARWGELPRAVHVALTSALVLGLFQSFIIMGQMKARFGFDTSGEMFFFAVLKSLPATLLLGTWILGRAAIGRILAHPQWHHVVDAIVEPVADPPAIVVAGRAGP